MKIGILATGSNEGALLQRFGSFAQMTEKMLSGSGFSFQTWDVRLGLFPESPEACDGWIITGSPASAYEQLPWIAPLEALIREICLVKRPLVGICFGHQIIAQALGGLVVRADAGWGLGIAIYQSTEAGVSVLGTEYQQLHVIHQDQVAVLPEGAQRLAGSQFCPNGVVRYGANILTVQAHPEFTLEYMQALLTSIAPEHISCGEADRGMESLQIYSADPELIVHQIAFVLKGGV